MTRVNIILDQRQIVIEENVAAATAQASVMMHKM
jgi:hypothetical protein